MNGPKDVTRRDPQPEERDRDTTAAPPLEREHETQEGAIEEDQERKERKREMPDAGTDRT